MPGVRAHLDHGLQPQPRRRADEAEQLQRPGAAQLDQLMRFGITTGMDPAEVADKVIAAVRDGRFWVLPHEGSADRVREVAARSYGDENPVLTPIAQQAGIAEPAPTARSRAAESPSCALTAAVARV